MERVLRNVIIVAYVAVLAAYDLTHPDWPGRGLWMVSSALLLGLVLSKIESPRRPASKWKRLRSALLGYGVIAVLFVAIGYPFHAIVFAPVFALITATFIFLEREPGESPPAEAR
jgi:hypothetical protein